MKGDISMSITKEQIDIVAGVIKENEHRLSDGFKYYNNLRKDGSSIDPINDMAEWNNATEENILKEIAKEILEKVNYYIYYCGI